MDGTLIGGGEGTVECASGGSGGGSGGGGSSGCRCGVGRTGPKGGPIFWWCLRRTCVGMRSCCDVMGVHVGDSGVVVDWV